MTKGFAKYVLVVYFLILGQFAHATEGMWLPQLLGLLNEKEMKSMGMKISASDIYNINKGSLKDAIVSFGGFCTGEIISDQGLILTNHHCGYGAIQTHSSIENNFLDKGFWAKSFNEELPNEGLFVTFIVRIEDVTKQALQYVKPGMSEPERQSAIDKQLAEIRTNYKKKEWESILIRPFFDGNQFFLFVTETFTDVRLVGAPPSSIGKFGADTDNWVWPRHTGDFSMFRVYAGKDNRPAPYSKDNVPLKPKYSLSVSLKGVKANDFTMVLGFPGRTTEYIPSEAVRLTVDILDSSKVAMRDAALKVMDGYMRKDEQIKIQYASKFASIANSWKKWMGEMQGVKKYGGIERKLKEEALFKQRIATNALWKSMYGTALDSLNMLHLQIAPYAQSRDYYNELIRTVEFFTANDKLIGFLNEVNKKGASEYESIRTSFLASMQDFYKDFNAQLDKDVAIALLDIYFKGVQPTYIGNDASLIWTAARKDGRVIAEKLYRESPLVSLEKLTAFVSQPYATVLAEVRKSPTTVFTSALRKGYADNVTERLNTIQSDINRLQRIYMKAQMDVAESTKRLYPDANSTLRVTYGKVDGYSPKDGVAYDHCTYLDGVIEKYVPGDYEFDVPAKLLELYERKDYGQYASNGKLPVCFIASNHTTGGNSGSPALDANGHLIGLNFDRTWEGTMSDINYDPRICRNIMVDIRYILFVVDKFAGAGHLVKEMKLVK